MSTENIVNEMEQLSIMGNLTDFSKETKKLLYKAIQKAKADGKKEGIKEERERIADKLEQIPHYEIESFIAELREQKEGGK